MQIDFSRLHNTQAEREVLNAILFNPYIYSYVSDIIDREIFQDIECQKVYDIIKGMVDAGKTPDSSEIFTIMRNEGLDIGHFLMENIAASELTRQRLMFLDDLRIRRKLLNIFYKAEAMAVDTTITMEDIRGISKEFNAVINNDQQQDCLQFSNVIESLMNDIADRKNEKVEAGMMTGLHIFDSRFGWHGGDLVIIAGGTSQGKSTLAATIAANMAGNGIPVAYYSMEMSAKQLTARMLARHTQVSSSTTLYAKLNDTEYQQVYDTALGMKQLPIYFDEDSKTSFPKLLSSAHKMVARHKVRVIFIDYLQILANGGRDNREQLLGDMARDLKRLAVDEDVCVVALSQLNRPKDDKSDPRLNQMRGSGQIEEACDIAVLISRQTTQNTATLYIAKGRNIGLAKEKVKFNTNLSFFADFEEGDPQAPYQEKKEQLPF